MIEIILEYPDLEKDVIEYEILKKLKQKYNFKVTEILEDKMELRDSFPYIYRCEFYTNSATFTLLSIKENNAVKDLCFILGEHVSFNEVRIKNLELMSFFKINKSSEILNLNLQDNTLTNFEIEFTSENKDSDKTTAKFIFNNSEDNNLAVINLNTDKTNMNIDQFINYIDQKKKELSKNMDDYCSTQKGNIIFAKTEVVSGE
jgi:hypothetical protein